MLEMNKVFLIGNLTQDPEVRSLTSGTPVAEFGLAVNRRYRDRNGERQEETLFIQVESWGRLAEFCGDWLKKGRRVFVEGRLRLDSWETKDGSKRSRIKVRADRIQFADLRPVDTGDEASPRRDKTSQGEPSKDTAESKEAESNATDDDLPF
jgi:single-strand DNA-binding protein